MHESNSKRIIWNIVVFTSIFSALFVVIMYTLVDIGYISEDYTWLPWSMLFVWFINLRIYYLNKNFYIRWKKKWKKQ